MLSESAAREEGINRASIVSLNRNRRIDLPDRGAQRLHSIELARFDRTMAVARRHSVITLREFLPSGLANL